jgi:hypothetical protein
MVDPDEPSSTALPEYLATTDWVSLIGMRLVQETEPEELIENPAHSVELPSVNVTVPLRPPIPGAITETVATNVTGWRGPDESGVDLTTVLVTPFPTVWVIGPDTDCVKFALPV